MAKLMNHNDVVVQWLKQDLNRCKSYLRASIEEDGTRGLLIALRHVIDAQGGIGKASKEVGLHRVSMYKALSGNFDPRISTVTKLLESAGYTLPEIFN